MINADDAHDCYDDAHHLRDEYCDALRDGRRDDHDHDDRDEGMMGMGWSLGYGGDHDYCDGNDDYCYSGSGWSRGLLCWSVHSLDLVLSIKVQLPVF